LRVAQVKVDELKQRIAQRRGVVIAGRGPGAGRAEPRIDLVRLEEAGLPQGCRHERTREIARLAIDVAIRRVVPDLAGRDAIPENPKPLEATLRRIAGDDRRIDAADRNAADPVRLHAFFVQGLIDTGLVGAKRAAALQDEGDTVASIGPPSAFNYSLGVRRTRVHGVSSEFPYESLHPRIQMSGDILVTTRPGGWVLRPQR
jgi:hypothetical protein